jgi:hypothetical protein
VQEFRELVQGLKAAPLPGSVSLTVYEGSGRHACLARDDAAAFAPAVQLFVAAVAKALPSVA